MRGAALAASAIVALTLLSFFIFPGHTFLQSDTQIYIPILERLNDPSLFTQDLIALRPHVSYTTYDEVAVGLRRLTGASFQAVLVAQQLIYRALGIAGVILIGTASGLSLRLAIFPAALYAVGATISGPAVLTVEYEPVPRGFAVPLSLLAIGLCAHKRLLAASTAGGLALLYHPPTVYPFAIVLALYAAWQRRFAALAPFAAACGILVLLSRVQEGATEPQTLFAAIDWPLEQIQRLRGSYNWVSIWIQNWAAHFLALWIFGALATWRLWAGLGPALRFFFVGLPAIGLLSVPASYLLLEKAKWALIPQFQPARGLLFVTLVAVVAGAIAAMQAAVRGRWAESFGWLLPVLAVPVNNNVAQMVTSVLDSPLIRTRWLLVIVLSLLIVLAARLQTRTPALAFPAMALALVALFVAPPGYGQIRNYPPLHHPDIDALANWARGATAKDAVFLFPAAGRDLAPGVFRAQSLRALYVDWKSGGQVNFLREYAEEWSRRWKETMAVPFDPARLENLSARGIDYVVLPVSRRIEARAPVYENRSYVVYRLE